MFSVIYNNVFLKRYGLVLSLLSIFNLSNTSAQNSAAILQSLHKLNTVGSVLYVAAHPDDENTRLLAYLSKEMHLRTAYLSLTRGDGGQNLIGSEQGDMLGVIRTGELLAARNIDGAEQWFTRAVDFGYSKSPDETFTHWNKKNFLGDVVYAIRKFRPDVIICRFPSTGEGGHGHHTASAILASEAFDLAGDPNSYPEQLKYVDVWQPKKLFWNTFNFGGNNTTAPNQIKMDIGTFNVLEGKSYGEIASESRSCHKSQGFGSAASRGEIIEYFKQIKGDSSGKSLFYGIDLSWNRLNNGAKIAKSIQKCIGGFDPLHPHKSIQSLLKLYASLKSLPSNTQDNYYLQLKLKELEQIIFNCAGIWMETNATDVLAIPGNNIRLNANFIVRNPVNVKLNSIAFMNVSDTAPLSVLKSNSLFKFSRSITLPSGTEYSDPYWLKTPHENAMHFVDDPISIGKPKADCPIKSTFIFSIDGVEFKVVKQVVYKFTDPVKGERYKPIEILPAVTVTPLRNVMITGNGLEKSLFFLVKSNVDDFEGMLNVKSNGNIDVKVISPSFKLEKKGEEIIIEVRVKINETEFDGNLKAYVVAGNSTYGHAIQRIDYDHIPSGFILKESSVRLIRCDLKTSGGRIAYIEGAGDDVAECLQEIGYDVTVLDNEMLMKTDLSVYKAIVCGIRAFNTNEKLYLAHDRLMEYVKKGGVFVVQYNTNSRVGPISAGIGPYKFNISRTRVTDEKAKVEFLNDTMRVLNSPNKISNSDFDGWVQERGIYFATDLDSAYQCVFNMNDVGESPNKGSLVLAKYGNGHFVYTGLAFFRQLPAAVPGAYRLFVNLISLNE